MRESRYDTIQPGDSYTLQKEITEQMVQVFADLSGDYNPVHMDSEYCKENGLGSRIAHGILTLSSLSALIGMYLPGPGTVWLSQCIDFISPVRIGDTVKITGKVTKKDNRNALALNIIEMKITAVNQHGTKIARGNIKVSVR